MCLPILPAEHIIPVFRSITQNIPQGNFRLHDLSHYIEQQWLEGRNFGPGDISVWGQMIRTNNDVEGWHNRLNNRGRNSNLSLYLLIHLLQTEGRHTLNTMTLVYQEDMGRRQRRQYRNTNTQLLNLWDKYRQGTSSANATLRKAARIICPKID